MDPENPYSPPSTPLAPAPGSPWTPSRSQPRTAPGKVFSLDCSCGRRINVTSADAGTRVACECGLELAVPSLSRLRELEGRDPYEAGTVDTIRRLVAHGELPVGEVCAVSGKPTHDVMECFIVVSSVMLHRERMGLKILLGLLISPVLFLIPSLSVKVSPAPGTETWVPTPMRLSNRYHSRYRGASQTRLRRLLSPVPIYRKLLEEYPLARVVVPGPF